MFVFLNKMNAFVSQWGFAFSHKPSHHNNGASALDGRHIVLVYWR